MLRRMKNNNHLNIESLEDLVSLKDIQILRRTREIYTLENRLKRYRKKLTLEGLKIAKEFDLKFNLKNHDNYVDASPITELAQINYPSLYRRYCNLERKYFKKLNNLSILLSE